MVTSPELERLIARLPKHIGGLVRIATALPYPFGSIMLTVMASLFRAYAGLLEIIAKTLKPFL